MMFRIFAHHAVRHTAFAAGWAGPDTIAGVRSLIRIAIAAR